MELSKMIDDVQRALVGHEELNGAWVRMTMVGVGPDGQDVDIKFIVPRANLPKGEPEAQSKAVEEEAEAMHASMPEMLREVAEMMMGQIDMTRESMVADRPEGERIAEINRSICELAHSVVSISSEHRRWEEHNRSHTRMMLEQMRATEARNDESMRRWVEGPCAR